MNNNTLSLQSSGATAKFECHAHFPGSGPIGEICARCSLLVPDGSRFVCDKYRQMVGRKGKPISPNSSACRYFSARKPFNATKG